MYLRLLLCFAFTFLGTAVHADLVQMTDTSAPGGINNITRDTSTNLEWLDWNATTNLSFNNVQTMFVSGGDLEGWRHATSSEIESFSENIGLPTGNWPGFSGVVDSGASANDAFGLLGATQTFSNGGIRANGIFTGTEWVQIQQSVDSLTGDPTLSSTFVFALWDPDSVSSDYGHALVRAATVPEPSSVTILVIGLGAVLVRRRSRD